MSSDALLLRLACLEVTGGEDAKCDGDQPMPPEYAPQLCHMVYEMTRSTRLLNERVDGFCPIVPPPPLPPPPPLTPSPPST